MIRVRPGIPHDLPALKEMLREFTDHLHAIDPNAIGSDTDIARIEDLVFGEGAPARALIAEQDEAAVGYLIYFHGVWMDPASRALFVADLFVRDGMRGAGTGRALMAAAHKIGRAEGAQRVIWTVWRKNPASIRFYEQIGASLIEDELIMTIPVAATEVGDESAVEDLKGS